MTEYEKIEKQKIHLEKLVTEIFDTLNGVNCNYMMNKIKLMIAEGMVKMHNIK